MRLLHPLLILIGLSAILATCADLLKFTKAFLVLKPLTTCLIIALHISLARQLSKPYFVIMTAALIFCLGGDVLLMDEQGFVFGLASFLVAHLLFTALIIYLGGWRFNWLVFIALVLYGSGFFWLLAPQLGAMMVPVVIYQTVISVMLLSALGLALAFRERHTLLIAVAAILFAFSDSIIAINRFVFPFDASPVLILPTYWLSITLLVVALARFAAQQHSTEAND